MEPRIGTIETEVERMYGIKIRSIQDLDVGVANMNYKLDADTNSYIFKVYKKKNEEMVTNELLILKHLSIKGFDCSRVVKKTDGSLVSEHGKKPAALFKYINGEMVRTELIDTELLNKVGKQLGTLHVYLSSYKGNNTHETWEPCDIVRILKEYKDTIVENGFEDEYQYVLREMTALNFPVILPNGFTHQDVKPDNIIISEDKIYFIDFGNAYSGVLLYDLLTPVIWMCFDDEMLNVKKYNAYLKGYESARILTDDERTHLHDALSFRVLRETVIWMWLYDSEEAKKYTNNFVKIHTNLKKRSQQV